MGLVQGQAATWQVHTGTQLRPEHKELSAVRCGNALERAWGDQGRRAKGVPKLRDCPQETHKSGGCPRVSETIYPNRIASKGLTTSDSFPDRPGSNRRVLGCHGALLRKGLGGPDAAGFVSVQRSQGLGPVGGSGNETPQALATAWLATKEFVSVPAPPPKTNRWRSPAKLPEALFVAKPCHGGPVSEGRGVHVCV